VTYYGHAYPRWVLKPTADKTQSKVWYADGSVWALMVSVEGRVHIFELVGSTWRDTGVLVDSRRNSTGDALWLRDQQSLVVASRHESLPLRVVRFSYDRDARTWRLARGFPADVTTGGSESAVIGRDSTGRLWVTYTRQSKVWVAYSEFSGRRWSRPFNPPVPDVTLASDDISSLIAFDGKIGVMWSDQQSDAVRFAMHRDRDPVGTWSVETAFAGRLAADDHINLKTAQGPGDTARVYAAVKTSRETIAASESLLGVLERRPGPPGTGTWSYHSAGTAADNHSRPLLMVDEEKRLLYLFAESIGRGWDIRYKTAPLDHLSFRDGVGARFLDITESGLSDVTGSKQNLTAKSPTMTVLASAEGIHQYVFGRLGITDSPFETRR
jgi:hypothetical protein